MSQYNLNLNNGKQLLFGFDAPTGGFFYSEFSIGENGDEKEVGHDGLTLTELIEKYDVLKLSIGKLIVDYLNAEHPTQLQMYVASMFNKNLDQMLSRVDKDIQQYLEKK